MLIKKNNNKQGERNMSTKNIKQFIKEHNEFPLNKKISEPLDSKGAKIIIDVINSYHDEPGHNLADMEENYVGVDIPLVLRTRKFYQETKAEILALGFKDHWENFSYRSFGLREKGRA